MADNRTPNSHILPQSALIAPDLAVRLGTTGNTSAAGTGQDYVDIGLDTARKADSMTNTAGEVGNLVGRSAQVGEGMEQTGVLAAFLPATVRSAAQSAGEFLTPAAPFLTAGASVLEVGEASYNLATAKTPEEKSSAKKEALVTGGVLAGGVLVGVGTGALLVSTGVGAAVVPVVVFGMREHEMLGHLHEHEKALQAIKPDFTTHENLKGVAQLFDANLQLTKKDLLEQQKHRTLTPQEQKTLNSDFVRNKDRTINLQDSTNQTALTAFIQSLRNNTQQNMDLDHQWDMLPEGMRNRRKELDYFVKEETRAKLNAAQGELIETQSARFSTPSGKTAAQIHQDIENAIKSGIPHISMISPTADNENGPVYSDPKKYPAMAVTQLFVSPDGKPRELVTTLVPGTQTDQMYPTPMETEMVTRPLTTPQSVNVKQPASKAASQQHP